MSSKTTADDKLMIHVIQYKFHFLHRDVIIPQTGYFLN